jgi:hypothetical protein
VVLRQKTRFLHSSPDVSVVASVSAAVVLAAGLLLVHLNDVILLHFKGLGRLVVVDTSSVEEEPKGGDRDTDALRVGLLQLPHLGGLLHAEVDLVRILADHLQLNVLGVVTHSERK